MLATVIFDAVLLGVIVYSGYWGYRRGLVKSIARIAKIFLAFSLAYAIAPYFSEIFIEPLLHGAVSNQLNAYLVNNFSDISSSTSYEELPTIIRALAAVFNLSLDFSSGAAIIDVIVAKLSLPLVRLISLPISFAIVYFLIKRLIRLAVKLSDEIFKVKLFGIPNKILGCVFSTVLGIISAFILTLIFNFVISLPPFADWALTFDGGLLYDLFNRFTPLELLLSF